MLAPGLPIDAHSASGYKLVHVLLGHIRFHRTDEKLPLYNLMAIVHLANTAGEFELHSGANEEP